MSLAGSAAGGAVNVTSAIWLLRVLPSRYVSAFGGQDGIDIHQILPLRGRISSCSSRCVFAGAVTLKGSRVAAIALTIFSLTYALFAWFVAAMSFSDSWL